MLSRQCVYERCPAPSKKGHFYLRYTCHHIISGKISAIKMSNVILVQRRVELYEAETYLVYAWILCIITRMMTGGSSHLYLWVSMLCY